MKYFKMSIITTILGIISGFFVGYYFTGSIGQSMNFAFMVLILGILEVSLSFDNAVVNVTVLEDMTEKWRKRFLTWGIIIAVFGMRLVFPLLIVSVSTLINPIQALQLAISDPSQYEKILTSSEPTILAFGGTFLLLIGIKFFLNEEKENHWFPLIESKLSKLGKINVCEYFIISVIGTVVYLFIKDKNLSNLFVLSFISANVVYFLIESLDSFFEKFGNKIEKTIKSGLSLFIYIEVLDASFSFDGVIGAFAISSNIFIIVLGLGIGAMFVRSMTIMLLETGKLKEFEYLEHGAFYAILSLAIIMYLKQFVQIPEIITCIFGAGLIGLSLLHSIIKNRNELVNEEKS